MFLPTHMAGVSALRTAMARQRVNTVAEVQPFLLRASAGFELVLELAPTSDELVLDKISMSAIWIGPGFAFGLPRLDKQIGTVKP
jgi:biuret amidohydrolase